MLCSRQPGNLPGRLSLLPRWLPGPRPSGGCMRFQGRCSSKLARIPCRRGPSFGADRAGDPLERVGLVCELQSLLSIARARRRRRGPGSAERRASRRDPRCELGREPLPAGTDRLARNVHAFVSLYLARSSSLRFSRAASSSRTQTAAKTSPNTAQGRARNQRRAPRPRQRRRRRRFPRSTPSRAFTRLRCAPTAGSTAPMATASSTSLSLMSGAGTGDARQPVEVVALGNALEATELEERGDLRLVAVVEVRRAGLRVAPARPGELLGGEMLRIRVKRHDLGRAVQVLHVDGRNVQAPHASPS